MHEGRFHLLIVDDEQDFLYSARKHFERRNFQVDTAEDGVAALEKFDATPGIDLMITDIRMPRMGGEELIQILRKRRPFLPILGVTGQPDLLDKLAFLDHGAYYFFDKPVERWLTAARYNVVGSGAVWPDLDAQRIYDRVRRLDEGSFDRDFAASPARSLLSRLERSL